MAKRLLMKKMLLLIICIFLGYISFGQLMIIKSLGKNSNNSQLGYGTFVYYDIPLNDEGNKSVRIELLDFAYFPPKNPNIISTIGYLSIKAGYKKIFSESKTGFYIEPQAGYCRVVTYRKSTSTEKTYGDGIALALETGYSLEVGQRGNTLNFGLKYESDLAGADYSAQTLGLRFSYSFHLFRRKEN